MKRAIEAHTTLVLALCNIFIVKKVDSDSQKDEIVTFMNSLKKTFSLKNDSQFQEEIDVAKVNFSEKLDRFFNRLFTCEIFCFFLFKKNFLNRNDECTALMKFVLNYVKQFENILQYIWSVREAHLELHLHSTYDYLKYFFAHKNLSYSRFLSLQLYTYQCVKKENPTLWKELNDNGNFVVTKNHIKFTSIGLDHGLEQEIKKLKIVGGIRGNNFTLRNRSL